MSHAASMQRSRFQTARRLYHDRRIMSGAASRACTAIA
jgi:hypothetical protein